jgi:hypothetical protein
MLYGMLMLWFFAFAYLAVGLRPLFVIPNATDIMLQGWAIQWGLYLGIAAFFEVFWVLRLFNKEYFSGRSQYGALIPLIGLAGFAVLLWLGALTDPYVVIHGWTTWIAPNLATYYGLGFTILTIACAICYMCLVPLIALMLRIRTRRELGRKVFIKDIAMWLGLLLIFVTVIADFALLFLPVATIEVIAVRVVMAIGFILLWFGYRLANLFLK